jgi:nucleoside-diphosphate-sugar epimerase
MSAPMPGQMNDGRLLLTGAPGWLASRFVDLYQGAAERHGLGRPTLRCLVEPGRDARTLEGAGVEVVRGDVRDAAAVAEALRGVERVVHAAGIIHPRRLADFDGINHVGARIVAEAAAAAGVARLVHVSSNSAQGVCDRRDLPLREDAPCRPTNPYGRSKLAGEQAARAVDGRGGMRVTIIRPCLYYGVRQPDRMLRLIKMVRAGRALVFGDGRNLRSMTFVDDLVDACFRALTREEAAGETFWIADRRPYETIEVLATIARVLGVPLRTIRLPSAMARAAELTDEVLNTAGIYQMDVHVVGESVRDIACDTAKAERLLGFAPTVGLEEGLRRAIAWSRDRGEL